MKIQYQREEQYHCEAGQALKMLVVGEGEAEQGTDLQKANFAEKYSHWCVSVAVAHIAHTRGCQ